LVQREQRGSLRIATTIVLLVSALALLGNIALPLWPIPNEMPTTRLRTSQDVLRAYSRIRPGFTRASELARYGFDSASDGTKLLSYLAVMESFIPHDSKQFDRLDTAIQECVGARERCTALIFQPADFAGFTRAHAMFAAFGMGADAASRTPKVTLLIRDGRVTFKMMSGVTEMTRASRDREARALPVPFRMDY
jgi:hypothetical protein